MPPKPQLSFSGLQRLANFAAMHGVRHDNMAMFVENELKAIIPETYDKLYPDLDASEHIPISQKVPAAAMSWAYDSIEKSGKAKLIGARANDIPRADVSKKRLTFPVRTMALAYGWSIEEIEASQMVGQPLDRMKADATRRGMAETEHDILLNGSPAEQIPGFLTNVKTPITVAPNGGWLTTATPDQILEDLNFMIDTIWVGTSRVHRPNTMLLPLAYLRKIQTTRITDTGMPIIDFFRQSNPFIEEIRELEELGVAGPTGGPRAMAYEKRDDRLSGIIPLPFQQMEPQIEGMEVVVPTRERIGGTVWYYPLAGLFMDGI